MPARREPASATDTSRRAAVRGPVPRHRTRQRRLAHGLGLGLLYLVAASATLDAFMTQWGPQLGDRLGPSLAFEQERPFAYRIATPFVIRTITELTPTWVEDRVLAVRDPSGRSLVDLAMQRYSWRGGMPVAFLALNGVLLASLLGLLASWRYLLATAVAIPRVLVDFVPALAALLLPLSFTRGGYAYDLPELLLASVAFSAFLERRHVVYYCVLSLAMLNKESSVLMLGWMLAQWLPPSRSVLRPALVHGALHAVIGGGILLALRIAFADRPGTPAELNLLSNLEFWLSLRWMLSVQDAFATGVPLPASLNLVNAVLLALLLGYGWSEAAPRLRRALVGGVVIMLPLFLTFGYLDEIRVFAPSFAPLIAVIACALARFYRSEDAALQRAG